MFLLQGIWLGIAVAAPLGPVNAALIDRGLRDGFRAAVLLGFGSTAADLLYILAAYAGAEPLARRAEVRLLLFGAGAAVLTWLGARAVRDAVRAPATGGAPGAAGAPMRRAYGPFAAGALITLVNPMTIAAWLGILGAELAARPRARTIDELSFVAAIVCGLTLWNVALSGALHLGRRAAPGRVLRFAGMAAGVSLIGFGAHFAVKAMAALP
jgi:threonine/homoserine/homoserine lactone efflux protein